jgi:hypothetical protein
VLPVGYHEAQSIHDPNHVAVESLTCDPFVRMQPRMLKLHDEVPRSFDIGDVPSAIVIYADDFLTFSGKIVLPRAMPFSF